MKGLFHFKIFYIKKKQLSFNVNVSSTSNLITGVIVNILNFEKGLIIILVLWLVFLTVI